MKFFEFELSRSKSAAKLSAKLTATKKEAELLAAITRWCEHEPAMEEEAKAARRVAEEWETAHPELGEINKLNKAAAGKSLLVQAMGPVATQVGSKRSTMAFTGRQNPT